MSSKSLGFSYKLSKNGKCLDISNQNISIPKNLYDKFGRKVTEIKASNNMIKDVDEFEKFINLQSLDLSSNMISLKKKSSVFTKLQRLVALKLDHNSIVDIDKVLDSVSQLKSLKNLSVSYNPMTPKISEDAKVKNYDYNRFRLYMIYHLPQLVILDNEKISPLERKNAERTGKFCRANKIDVPEAKVTELNIEEEDDDENRKRIRSYFGYTKKEYIGLNSQGNRFIKDL